MVGSKKYFILLSLLLCSAGVSNAQQKDTLISSTPVTASQLQYWVTLGYGGSTVSDGEFATGVGAEFTIRYGLHFFNIRVISDMSSRTDILPKEKIFDVGLLYGLGIKEGLIYANVSAGPAYTISNKRVVDYKDSAFSPPQDVFRLEKFKGVGLAMQLQLIGQVSDSSTVAWGVTFCKNFHKVGSFWHFMLSICFGLFEGSIIHS